MITFKNRKVKYVLVVIFLSTCLSFGFFYRTPKHSTIPINSRQVNFNIEEQWSSDQLSSLILNTDLIIKPQIDGDESNQDEIKLTIIVISSVENYEQRKVIRNTWGSWIKESEQRLFFIIGKLKPSRLNFSFIQPEMTIDDEVKTFSDIIQYDFIDSYRNLSIKSLLMLRFYNDEIMNLRQQVRQSDQQELSKLFKEKNQIDGRFLLKIDDDIFLHVQNLLQLLEQLINLRRNRSRFKKWSKSFEILMGRMIKSGKPVRRASSKYFLSNETYSESEYPDYLSGTSYLMSASVARSLYVTIIYAQKCQFFPMEDIFITGFCAPKAVRMLDDFIYSPQQRLNIRFLDNPNFKYSKICPDLDDCGLIPSHVITLHGLIPSQMRYIFKRLTTPSTLNSAEKCLNFHESESNNLEAHPVFL